MQKYFSLLSLLTAFTLSTPANAAPTITEKTLEAGTMTIYDYGNIKLHAYNTGDALNDQSFIIEGKNSLIGIELPSFTQNLEAWKTYIKEINKPMNNILVSAHPAGASYIEGITVCGTQNAKDAIAAGSTLTTAQHLHNVLGNDFHGNDIVQINKVIPEGKTSIDGINFNIINSNDTYDIEIPEINVVYTHMLGKKVHSIFENVEHMRNTSQILHNYQKAGYEMILSSHHVPEKQDAVTEKIAYIDTALKLINTAKSADEFKTAMKAAFPDYDGENYLDMTTNALFPTQIK